MEEAAVVMYNRFAGECAGHGDSVTKKFFEDLIIDEEGHYDQFDTQAGHVKKFGEQYLALLGQDYRPLIRGQLVC